MKKTKLALYRATITVVFFIGATASAETITVANNKTITITGNTTVDLNFTGNNGTAIFDGNTNLNSLTFSKKNPNASIIINNNRTLTASSLTFSKSKLSITNNGTFQADSLTLGCSFINDGQLECINATIGSNGILTNNETLICSSTLKTLGDGILTNNGNIKVDDDLKNYNHLTNAPNCSIIVTGSVSNYSASILTNNGLISSQSTLTNSGTFSNSGEINSENNVVNYADFTNAADGVLTSEGSLLNKDESIFINRGTIRCTSHIKNYSHFSNENRLISTSGYLSNYTSGTFSNYGVIDIYGNISNYNTLTNSETGSLTGHTGYITYTGGETNNFGSIAVPSSYYNYGITYNCNNITSGNFLNKESAIINCSDDGTTPSFITCTDLYLQGNSTLIIELNSTVNIRSDLYIESTPTSFPIQRIAGALTISDKVEITHSYLGGKWLFQTVPVTITDFSIYGETFNEDYAIFSYNEEVRSTCGHSDACWQRATILHPGQGYIFIFNTPTTVSYTLTGSEYLQNAQQNVALKATIANQSEANEGWNLVGNPHYIELEWDKSISNDNLNIFALDEVGSAIYTYDKNTGTYATYSDGIETNGATGIINPLAAFFIKACKNNVNLKINKSAYKSEAITTRSASMPTIIKTTFGNRNGSDQTVIRLKTGATELTDYKLDALKFPVDAPICQILTKTANQTELAINTVAPSSAQVQKDLHISIPSNGPYYLHFDLTNCDNYNLYLIDKLQNDLTEIINSDTLKYHLSIADSNRFRIVLKTANTTVSSHQLKNSLIKYQNGTITFPELTSDSQLRIYTIDGKLYFSKNLKKGTASFRKMLKKGSHLININNNTLLQTSNNSQQP